MLTPPRLALLLALAALPGLAPAQDGLHVGVQAELEFAATALEPAPGGAPVARLVAEWARVAAPAEGFDWAPVAAAVEGARAAGFRPVLALAGSHPRYLPDGGLPSPLVPGSLEAWLAFVRGAARTFAGRVEGLEIAPLDAAAAEPDLDAYALLIKQSALAARAEAAAAGTRLAVLQGTVPAGSLPLQRELWSRDLAAYIDALPVRLAPGDGAERVAVWSDELLLHPPAPALWVLVAAEQEGWAGSAAALAALSAGAAVALIDPAADREATAFALRLEAELASGYGAAPGAGVVLEAAPGTPWPGSEVIASFFRGADFTSLRVLAVPPLPGGPEQARLVIDPPAARNVRRVEPGASALDLLAPAAGPPAGRVFLLAPAPRPVVVSFERRPPSRGFDAPQEELSIDARRGLTAEEIIARHQERERLQADRLERWLARGRIDFHFKLPQAGSSVDVTVDSTFFWERGGTLEWEQTEYYINGNRVGWKNIPEIPLIQPEKVMTLPLDLTLDRTYVYRLAGEDDVDGRRAYVLEFQPARPDAAATLYRGRVWIDEENFARLKAVVIQTGLEAPVLSNEEIDRFETLAGPDGLPYQMLVSIDGQQNWNVAGHSLAVRREVRFTELQINPDPAAFAARRGEAYASGHQMLRDTDAGLRYLERAEDGTRRVQEHVDTSRLFVAGGAYKDGSLDSVVPLAGVNWLDYDLGGRGIQFNALFAGVFGLVTASKPELFGRKIDLTADAALSALRGDDKVYDAGRERLEERLEKRAQSLSVRLGLPAGSFFKLSLVGRVAWRQYFDSGDAARAIDAFNAASPPGGPILESIRPVDHVELEGQLEAVFNRRGWSLTGDVGRARRSRVAAWGLRDTVSGQFGHLDPLSGAFVAGGTEPLQTGSTRYGLTATKEWYLPRFQKIRGSANWLGGSDLDRFSRYEFSFFGQDRLSGFAGTGVRFDSGAIGRLGYAFNLFEVVRLDAGVEQARVRLDDDPAGTQTFTGLGVSGTVVGPWKSVINVSYGYALAADIPELEGEQEFMVLVLKLF